MVPVGAELSHADGQTDEHTADMMKLTVDCRIFENATKMSASGNTTYVLLNNMGLLV